MISWQLLYLIPLLAVAYSDYRRHIIPDYLIFILMVAGAIVAVVTKSPLSFVWGFVGFSLGILLMALAVLKMGDAKLMGVLGLILGQDATYTFYALFIAFFAGGAIALILTLRKSPEKYLPFGVPLCFSAILILIWQVIGSGQIYLMHY